MKLRFFSYSFGVGVFTVALVLFSPLFLSAAEFILPNTVTTTAIERISWSAILSGSVVALAIHMALSILGIGIGAASVDAYDRKNPAKGVPTMLFVWMFVSGLVALFAGGVVSGRMAGTVAFDSTLHGVITWALATVVVLVLAMTSFGYAVGGMFRILGESVTAAAKAATSVVTNVAQSAGDLVADNVPSINWKSIKRDAEELLQSVGEEVKEKATAGGGGQDHEQEKNGHRNRLKSTFEREDTLELIEKSYSVVRDGLNSTDRDSLKEALTSRMGVSEQEAEKTLEKWETNYEEAKEQYQKLVTKAEKTARDSADTATTVISRIAIWTFASLMGGMIIAGIGGYLGSGYFGSY